MTDDHVASDAEILIELAARENCDCQDCVMIRAMAYRLQLEAVRHAAACKVAEYMRILWENRCTCWHPIDFHKQSECSHRQCACTRYKKMPMPKWLLAKLDGPARVHPPAQRAGLRLVK